MSSSPASGSVTRVFAVLALASATFILGRISAPLQKSEAPPPKVSVPPAPAAPSAPAAGADTPSSSEPQLLSEGQVHSWKERVDQMTPSVERDEERQRMIVAWAKVNPLAALEYAQKNLKQDSQAQALSGVFAAWAKKDPNAAWNWVLTNAPGEPQHLRSVLSEIGKNEPATAQRFAASYAAQHPEQASDVYLCVLDGVIHGGKYEDAKTLVAQANMPNEEQKNNLFNFLAGQWARYQPEKASSWVLELPPGPIRDQALDAVGQAWSDVDPVRAADFAVSLPPGSVRQTALKQAISKWTMDDPAQASKWILQFDAHEDFDQAVMSLATAPNLMYRNVNLALSWAGTIQNEKLRNDTTTAIVTNWYPNDPAGAMNYIQTSPDLTPKARLDLMQAVSPTPQAPPLLRSR